MKNANLNYEKTFVNKSRLVCCISTCSGLNHYQILISLDRERQTFFSAFSLLFQDSLYVFDIMLFDIILLYWSIFDFFQIVVYHSTHYSRWYIITLHLSRYFQREYELKIQASDSKQNNIKYIINLSGDRIISILNYSSKCHANTCEYTGRFRFLASKQCYDTTTSYFESEKP